MLRANRIPPGKRWLALVLVAGVSLGMLRCSLPTDLGLPEWELPFSVAFSTERYSLSDLINPQELADSGFGFIQGDDDLLVFLIADTLDSVIVARDDLFLNDHEGVTFAIPTDTIVIPAPDQLAETYSLDDVFTALGIPTGYADGASIPIPPGGGSWTMPSNPAGDVAFEQLDTLKFAHVIDGELDLRLQNDTGIAFSSLMINVLRQDIYDEDLYRPLVTFNYSSVAPGQNIVRIYAMTDDTLTSKIRLTLQASGAEQTIIAHHADGLRFTMTMDTLKADVAEAIIGPQAPQTKSDIIYLDDDFWVKQAVVDSGFVNYVITNQTDVRTNITLTFPRVFRVGEGVPYDTTFDMERARPGELPQVAVGNVNLAGLEVRYPELPQVPGTHQEFVVQSTAAILGSGGIADTSRIAVGDSVISDFTLSDLVLRTANGVPKEFDYNINEQIIEINQFSGQEQLQQDLAMNLYLQQVNLIIDINNNIEAPMRMELNLRAINEAGNLERDTSVTRDLGRHQTRIVVEDMSRLINIMPDQFSITGTVTTGYQVFGVPDTTYLLNLDDFIIPSYHMEAPVYYVLTADTPLRPWVQVFEKPLAPDISVIKLFTIVDNALPTGGWLYLMAGRFDSEEEAQDSLVRANFAEYGLTYDENGLTPAPLRVGVSRLGPDGRPVDVFNDTLFTIIPQNRIKVFSKRGVYTRQVLLLEATDDDPVIAHTSDYLDVTVLGEVTFDVGSGN